MKPGHWRARQLYPAPLGECEGDDCTASAVERHHVDGDIDNNDRANVAFLCRRCHMKADGRLAALIVGPRYIAPLRPCTVCGRPSKPLRRGRCHACNEYLRRNGVDRADCPREANV